MTLDTQLFYDIHGLAFRYPWLDDLGIFFARYLVYVLCTILFILLFFPKNRQSKNRPMVVVAIVASLIARFIAKPSILFFYHHPRPFVAMQSMKSLIITLKSENYQSFPSGHALFFFAIATSLYFFNKKLGLWFFVAALIMGIARIFVGVHWPSDILGGALIAIATASLVQLFYKKYKSAIDTAVNNFFGELKI